MKISEEFLSHVLGKAVVSSKEEEDKFIISYAWETENGQRKTHHVDKVILANKCKLWALRKGYFIVSGHLKPYSKEAKIGADVFSMEDQLNAAYYAFKEKEEDAIIDAAQQLKNDICK